MLEAHGVSTQLLSNRTKRVQQACHVRLCSRELHDDEEQRRLLQALEDREHCDVSRQHLGRLQARFLTSSEKNDEQKAVLNTYKHQNQKNVFQTGATHARKVSMRSVATEGL